MTRSFVLYSPHRLLFGGSNREDWDGWDMCHVWERGWDLTGFCWRWL